MSGSLARITAENIAQTLAEVDEDESKIRRLEHGIRCSQMEILKRTGVVD
jgi:hypothetical protein